MAYPVFFIG